MVQKRYRANFHLEPKFLVVHCVDVRFAEAIERFMEDLGVVRGRDIIKAFAGGPVPFAHPGEMKGRAKWLRKQVSFDFEKFETIETTVVIMHEDCQYYHTIPERCHRPGKERSDLVFIGKYLAHHFPDKRTLLYYARFTSNGTEIVFDHVEQRTRLRDLVLHQ